MSTMAPDFLVEVRDRDFNRIGQIAPEYLDLKYTEIFRGVGKWELKLPTEHPLLSALTTPGSGVIITETWDGGSRVVSGRTKTFTLDQNAEDPKGTWTIVGDDDGVVAMAAVVLPDPASQPEAQTEAYWKYSGNGESVMKQAVLLNLGNLALSSRAYPWVSVAANLNRGGAAAASARFDTLGVVLEGLGVQSGLGWRFYQNGAGVTFDVVVPQDKTGLVRLDIATGGLESSELSTSAPTATTAYVLGQGEGAARTVLPVSSAAAAADAVTWGLRWESTKDRRDSDDPADLALAGSEVIELGGTTGHTLKVAPSDAPGQRLGIDWGLGDSITVVIDGQETTAIVAQTATSVGPAGVIKQASVGDPVGFNWEARVGAAVTHQAERIDRLENYIDAAPRLPYVPLVLNESVCVDYNMPAGDDAWESARAYLRNGIVYLGGLVTLTATSGVIATLPPGYRPDYRVMGTVSNSNVLRTVDILTNGDIVLRAGMTLSYLSLANVAFPAAGTATWTNITSFGTGFAQYVNAAYPNAGYWRDKYGLTWLRGLISVTSAHADNDRIFSLPAGYAAHKESHMVTAANDVMAGIGAATAARPNDVNIKPALAPSGAWLSLFGVTLVTQTAWSEPGTVWRTAPADFPMWNSWSAFPGTGTTYTPVAYGVRPDGVCLTTGLVAGGLVGSSNSTNRMFDVPDPFRSLRSKLMHSVSNGVYARIDVHGRRPQLSPGRIIATAGDNAWFSLDGLKWVPDLL